MNAGKKKKKVETGRGILCLQAIILLWGGGNPTDPRADQNVTLDCSVRHLT